VSRLAGLLILTHAADSVWRRSRNTAWRGFVRRYQFQIALAMVAGVALAIRLAGFGVDIGHQPLDIDEERLASNVKNYFVTGQIGHTQIEQYPGAVFWLFSAASFESYLHDLSHGRARTPADVPVETFVRSARMTNVLVGVGIVVVTGLIARRVTGMLAALLAALLVAMAPLSVEAAEVRNDSGMVLAALGATAVALAFMNDSRRTWALWAGALAGMAGAIKYTGACAIVPVLLATWSPGALSDRLQRAGFALIGFVGAVAVTNHFMWYDFPNLLLQLSEQTRATGWGYWGATFNPAAFYVAILSEFGVGTLMLALAAAFTVRGLASQDRRLWIVLSFPILYMWFMTGRPRQLPRWVLPLLPFVAVAACAALDAVVRFVRGLGAATVKSGQARLAVSVVLIAAALAQPAWSAVVLTSRGLKPLTTILAERWIEANVPAGDVVLLEEGWLSLSSKHVVRRVPNLDQVLDGGVEQLQDYDWVVIPGRLFDNPTVRRLGFAQRFIGSQGFGGRRGSTIAICTIPKLRGRR
jgi:4-amino-4-deoxy-L-arabinose transferase-like glycosyltransferase